MKIIKISIFALFVTFIFALVVGKTGLGNSSNDNKSTTQKWKRIKIRSFYFDY